LHGIGALLKASDQSVTQCADMRESRLEGLTRGWLQYRFTESLKGGKHKRGFCANCGSRLTGAESDTPSPIVGVVAGSLDDPSWFRPQMDIFTSDAQPWDQMDPAIPKYENYPPG
jgi:hypothetical protein